MWEGMPFWQPYRDGVGTFSDEVTFLYGAGTCSRGCVWVYKIKSPAMVVFSILDPGYNKISGNGCLVQSWTLAIIKSPAMVVWFNLGPWL